MGDALWLQVTAVSVAAAVGLVGLRRVLAGQPDLRIRQLIVLGLGAKLAGSFARYSFMADLYDGRGDFNRYFDRGRELAVLIRSGSLPDEARETGTPFMEFLVGVVYAAVPNRLSVGFAVFAILSFVGALYFLLAFQLAIPDGNHRLYAGLVFFLPTMVFWPSSIGKEAWLVFTLGVAAYGAARVLRSARYGYLIAAVGMTGVFLVRPHMGALIALSFAGAFVLRFRDPDVSTNAIAWILGLLIVALGAGYAASNFGDELPRDESVEGTATDQVFAETTRRTSQGGSAFDSRPVRNPVDFLHAAVTVPFRPFPTEAHNRQAQVASLEGVLFLALIALSLPRLANVPRLILRRPFIAMAAAYCVGFIVAFSNVGNFGILTRQRAQLLPFIIILLCLPRKGSERQLSDLQEQEDAVVYSGVVPSSQPPVLVLVRPAGEIDAGFVEAPEASGDAAQIAVTDDS